ncbi:hypothetical protein LJC14_03425 [Treponema sp. OttesenSCG-928-L16]|nr:hypothetical protein [Treponema sp. OttesenSCG-928-L16]
MVTVLRDIPWEYTMDEFLAEAGVLGDPELAASASAFAAEAFSLLRPKAVYTRAQLKDLGRPRLAFDEKVFSAEILHHVLNDSETVYPFVATSGNELEDMDLSPYDELAHFWRDLIKNAAVVQAEKYLHRYVSGGAGGRSLSAIHPGAGNGVYWPLDQIHTLFSFFPDIMAQTGVEMTEGCFMRPNKTVAGILFASEISYTSCSFCLDKQCGERRNPPVKLS